MKIQNKQMLRRLAGGLAALSGIGFLVTGLFVQRVDVMVLGLAALLVVMAGLVVGLRFRVATLSALVEHQSSSTHAWLLTQFGDFKRTSLESSGLVLRAFRDLDMSHREHAARMQDSAQALASLPTSLEDLRSDVSSLLGLATTIEAALSDFSGRIDEVPKRTAKTTAEVLPEKLVEAMAPRVEISEKLMRQIIRDVDALPPKVGKALDASMVSRAETSEKLMRQIIRDADRLPPKVVDALQASMAPGIETSEKLMRQVIRDVGKLPAEVASSASNFLSSNEKLNDLAHRALTKIQRETMQEAEALMQIHRLFDLDAPMPLLGGWAMEPVAMLALVNEVLQRRPSLVVECGSGTSTAWIAHALRHNGAGTLVSLEHLDSYAALGDAVLNAHGLGGVAEIRRAPLEAYQLGAETFRWYKKSTLGDVRDIAMLVVDGPPRSTGPLARYPALPLLQDRLLPGALVIVDDVGRKDEQEVVERWQREDRGLVNPRMISERTMAFDYRPEGTKKIIGSARAGRSEDPGSPAKIDH